MTLLLAGVEGDYVWMAADTAITHAKGHTHYRSKIKVAQGRSLIDYAGAADGWQLLCRAAALAPGAETLAFLGRETAAYGEALDLAYAFMQGEQPVLYKIADGRAAMRRKLYLGNSYAYAKFQKLKAAGRAGTLPPRTVDIYIFESSHATLKPQALAETVPIFFDLFASMQERSVGGWVVPYFLGKDGAELGSYYCSSSDPVLGNTAEGQLIPHGTPQAGGFTMCFTGLPEGDGTVVYWLQKPGGKILIEDGFDIREIDLAGMPGEFVTNAEHVTGRKVTLTIGDRMPEAFRHTASLNDAAGNCKVLALSDGKSVSFYYPGNTADPFKTSRFFSREELLGDS